MNADPGPMRQRGLFVTFEGVEGAGKSTQARMLASYLETAGIPALLLREPGGTPMAEAVRSILLDAAFGVCAKAETLLFLAARAQNTAERILPAVGSGITVVCDRYSDSTVAYQGYGRGADVEVIKSLIAYATNGVTPDLTVLLDLDPIVGLERQANRNRMEDEPIGFHRRVREGYLAEASTYPDRICVLDGAMPEDVLHAQIVGIVMARLRKVQQTAQERESSGGQHEAGTDGRA